jgi:hypothetical protein
MNRLISIVVCCCRVNDLAGQFSNCYIHRRDDFTRVIHHGYFYLVDLWLRSCDWSVCKKRCQVKNIVWNLDHLNDAARDVWRSDWRKLNWIVTTEVGSPCCWQTVGYSYGLVVSLEVVCFRDVLVILRVAVVLQYRVRKWLRGVTNSDTWTEVANCGDLGCF